MAPPTVLSLFSGIGGIDLGLKKAGFRTICYVENDPYAVRVLQARMDGNLDEAPIWDDVRTFDGKEWRDGIDLIAGGFPCQDLSFAGKRAGINGSRSGLWAEMFRAVCEVRPRIVLVENVPGILVGGLGRVLGDLASAGYDAVWTVLSAAAIGAPHLRKRVFIVAHAHGDGCDGAGLPDLTWEEGALPPGGGEGEEGVMWRTPDANTGARGPKSWESYRDNPKGHAISLNDQVRWPTPRSTEIDASRTSKGVHGFNRIANDGREWGMNLGTAVKMWPTPGAGDAQKVGLNPAMMKRVQARLDGSVPCAPSGANYQESLPERVALEEARNRNDGLGQLNPAWEEILMGFPVGWTDLEAEVGEFPGWPSGRGHPQHPYEPPRVAKGIPDRAKRLRCLGNAVVPQCAERIGKRIMEAWE